MRVTFYKGVVRTESGEERAAAWATTPFGSMGLLAGTDLLAFEGFENIARAESVAGFDLPGVDREGVETIVRSILMGGYLDKPGVKGKDEAVLFMLANEAIHKLEEIARDEGA
jgi:hypothetical protein